MSPAKVQQLNAGRAPLVEPGLPELVDAVVSDGNLTATTNPDEAVFNSDLSIVCVGTPTGTNGEPDLRHVVEVSRQIGAAIGRKGSEHVVVVRSTVMPGTTRDFVLPCLQAGAGSGWSSILVAHNPEFLREGSAIRDFNHPARTVIGASEDATGAKVAQLYSAIDAPIITHHSKQARW